jgi:hypothetical protein
LTLAPPPWARRRDRQPVTRLDATVTDTAPPGRDQAAPAGAPRPRREILGPTGLVVMVAAILAFTAVSIVIELVSNTGRGTFYPTVDVLGPVAGSPNQVRVVFHVRNGSKKAGRPDKCEATLFDRRRERVGTAAVSVREQIQPGETLDLLSTGTAASRPVNGTARCRSLEPG